MKILFATSEVHPLIKTGGLADVSGSLPNAYAALKHKVRIVMPGYRDIWPKLTKIKTIANFEVEGCFRRHQVTLKQARNADIDVPIWVVDIPDLFDRPGNPYLADDGSDWWDNGERFGIFSKIVADLAVDRFGLKWKPDLVQANDWQTGLVPALISEMPEQERPKTIFTIHNMAYKGLFPHSLFSMLKLPWHWWNPEGGVEFYGNVSMLKAGIEKADWVTTVSPTYAREITFPEFAYGLEGVLQRRAIEGRLRGIINGIDLNVWNPEVDELITKKYSAAKGRVAAKKVNKKTLLQHWNWADKDAETTRPVVGLVGRLVWQKGIDLVLKVIPELIPKTEAIFVIVGSGDKDFHQQLQLLADKHPGRILLYIGYSEKLAHMVEAGADMFLMPSRFEPCGLNQMYSLTYGTPPIVHNTGGLADTVVNASDRNLEAGTATGFVFYDPSEHALKSTMMHALYLYGKKRTWQKLQKQGMQEDFGWRESAKHYLELIKQV